MWIVGVRHFQRTLDRMTWYMQQGFYPLKLVSSANVPCLIYSLKLIGYFAQRYVNTASVPFTFRILSLLLFVY